MAVEKDPIKEIQKEFGDQFTAMRAGIEQIAKDTGEELKETKDQTKREKEKTRKSTRNEQRRSIGVAPGPKVELGKQTRKEILSALTNIRSQIVVSQRRETTASDVAADFIAGGGGLIGAAKAASAFKAKKLKTAFKRKFDPLNIIHRMTGGSKLATALAGRVMGRSEQSIRGAAGLTGGIPEGMQEQSGSPTQFEGPDTGTTGATQISSAKSIDLFEKMSTTLFRIEGLLEEGLKISQEQATQMEQLKDSAALQNAKDNAESPVQVSADGKTKTAPKKEASWMDNLLIWFVAIGAAVIVLMATWEKLKISLSMLGDTITELWQTIKDTLTSIADWTGNTLTKASDAVLDAKDNVVNSVKGMGMGLWSKLTGNPEVVPTAQQRHEELTVQASEGNERAQRKLSKEVAPEGTTTSVLGRLAPKFAEKLQAKGLPGDELAPTVDDLGKGNYVDSTVKSLMGVEPPSGSPTRVAATGTLGQMVGEAYGEIYKDADGKPMRPSKDPESGPRLEKLTREASSVLANAMAPKSPSVAPKVPGPVSMAPAAEAKTPTEMIAAVPQTGRALNESMEFQKDAAAGKTTGGTNGGNATIVNVKNNNSSSTTVHQNMAPARSGESSYLRSLDRGFSPA